MVGKESEPDYARDQTTDKNVHYYYDNIDDEVAPESRQFITAYSIQRYTVYQITKFCPMCMRLDKAWAIRAYPCIGQGLFLTPLVNTNSAYLEILERLRCGGRLIEVGIFIGHDLRRLTFEGARSENMDGVDIVSHWEAGHDFSNDCEDFHAHFIDTGILHPNPKLVALNGTLDIIFISKVLHQWDWESQLAALRSIIAFPRPGSIVVSFHSGWVIEGFVAYKKGPLTMGLHDKRSWERLLGEAGKDTDTTWDANQVIVGKLPKSLAWVGEKGSMMDFVVREVWLKYVFEDVVS